MESINMLLPVTSLAKTFPTVFTLVRFDLVMNCLNMPGEISLRGKLDTTCGTLEVLLFKMDGLEMILHVMLMTKSSPAFFTLVIYTFVCGLLMFVEVGKLRECLVTSFN